MNQNEIDTVIKSIESLWFEHQLAKEYLHSECHIDDPTAFLQARMNQIPPDAVSRHRIAPLLRVFRKALEDSEVLKAFEKFLQEFASGRVEAGD